MSQNPQMESSDVDSILQPGVPLNPCLPDALEGPVVPEEKACQGIYSDIFKGTWNDKGTERVVCLKVLRQVHMDLGGDSLRKEAKERFRRRVLRETWIWGKSNHENIFPFYGYKMIGEDAYLVSPWADNGSLDAYLVRNPQLLVTERLQISLQVARGLAYLHGLVPPIVHGDVKPGNILLRSNSPAALCDFGLSRVMVTTGHSGLTTGAGCAGTSGYLAIEIIEGNRATPKSDVYAMAGIILATMSGDGPFHQKPTAAKVHIAVYTGEKCQPRDHPKFPETDPMWSFLYKCWESDQVARPHSQEVVEELEKSLSSYQAPAPPYETVEATPDSKSDTAPKPEAN